MPVDGEHHAGLGDALVRRVLAHDRVGEEVVDLADARLPILLGTRITGAASRRCEQCRQFVAEPVVRLR